jgi:His/Glu/Gln/Arg/opine family amino acid ABC transporter permease subunit
MFDFSSYALILSFWKPLLMASFVTVALTALTFLFGSIIAIILVLMRKSHNTPLVIIAQTYSVIFKAIPALVMVIWVYYALPLVTGVTLSPFVSGLLALTLNLAPFLAESFISGINSIAKEQYESATLIGMNKIQVYRYIVFPQVLKNISSDLVGWFITELKFTSLVSVIGLNELLHITNTIISNTFLPFEAYTTLAIFYLVIVVLFELIIKKFTKIKYKVLI